MKENLKTKLTFNKTKVDCRVSVDVSLSGECTKKVYNAKGQVVVKNYDVPLDSYFPAMGIILDNRSEETLTDELKYEIFKSIANWAEEQADIFKPELKEVSK